MRTLPVLICIIGLLIGIATAQHGAKQVPLRYEPAAVSSAVEAVYPLQSVTSGTVVLELSLDEGGQDYQYSCCPRNSFADGALRTLCPAMEVSVGKIRWNTNLFENRRGLLLRSAQYWPSHVIRRSRQSRAGLIFVTREVVILERHDFFR